MLRALGDLTGGLVALYLLFLALDFAGNLRFKPEYDRSGRDYEQIARAFERVRKFDRALSPATDLTLDFSELLSGNWKAVCLFGGYTNPLKTAEQRGWSVAEGDRERLEAAAHRGLRAAAVEEFEALVAYVDDFNNEANFIHLENGVGVMGQHLESCISKPETKMDLTLFWREWNGG
ncbi:hypothetical protein [Bosea sp. LjRoot237]|uniref:hypothetical protein n=1 Tax=Bosea sp. LjRoot237 TaxID=3342292 RepID=UPI003ECFE16F